MNKLKNLTPMQMVLSIVSVIALFGIVTAVVVSSAHHQEARAQRQQTIDEMPIIVEESYSESMDAKKHAVAKMEFDIPEPEPEPAPVVEQTYSEPVVQEYVEPEPEPAPQQTYADNSFKSDGVWYDSNYRYTWYSSNVLYHYRTPEWTAGADGIYRDAEGYVVVASSDLPQGTVVEGTPFGACKVYDSGCASGTLDVYTNF